MKRIPPFIHLLSVYFYLVAFQSSESRDDLGPDEDEDEDIAGMLLPRIIDPPLMAPIPPMPPMGPGPAMEMLPLCCGGCDAIGMPTPEPGPMVKDCLGPGPAAAPMPPMPPMPPGPAIGIIC